MKSRISPLGSLADKGRCGLSAAFGKAITTPGDFVQTFCMSPSLSAAAARPHHFLTRSDVWLTGRFQQQPLGSKSFALPENNTYGRA